MIWTISSNWNKLQVRSSLTALSTYSTATVQNLIGWITMKEGSIGIKMFLPIEKKKLYAWQPLITFESWLIEVSQRYKQLNREF